LLPPLCKARLRPIKGDDEDEAALESTVDDFAGPTELRIEFADPIELRIEFTDPIEFAGPIAPVAIVLFYKKQRQYTGGNLQAGIICF
jgi:hypothetical protein